MTESQFKDIFVHQTKLHPYRTFLVECDYDCCVWYYDLEEKAFFPIDEGDKVFLYPELEDNEQHITVAGLTDWRKEFGPVLEKLSIGKASKFDWESWNRRGMELATDLRRLLPDGYYVYYTPPYEDPSAADKPPVLV